jgi:hypothetical protein
MLVVCLILKVVVEIAAKPWSIAAALDPTPVSYRAAKPQTLLIIPLIGIPVTKILIDNAANWDFDY